MLWASVKTRIQDAARRAGYRIVPKERDSQSLREWLLRQPIRTVIDVGASTGETVKDWLKSFPAAEIHAIEPLPASFAKLSALQPQWAPRLKTYNLAAGDREGVARFHVHPAHHTSSSMLARTEYAAKIMPETEEEQTIEVRSARLDHLFADTLAALPREVLLKLDVQGVETQVIAGAQHLLKHTAYIYTEVSVASVYEGQSDFNAVHAALTGAGFALKGFVEQFHLADLTPIYFDLLYVNRAP